MAHHLRNFNQLTIEVELTQDNYLSVVDGNYALVDNKTTTTFSVSD